MHWIDYPLPGTFGSWLEAFCRIYYRGIDQCASRLYAFQCAFCRLLDGSTLKIWSLHQAPDRILHKPPAAAIFHFPAEITWAESSAGKFFQGFGRLNIFSFHKQAVPTDQENPLLGETLQNFHHGSYPFHTPGQELSESFDGCRLYFF